MKHIVWMLLFLFLVAGLAAGETINISYIEYSFRDQVDLDGNADYSFQGTQISLKGITTAGCNLCLGYYSIWLPGTFIVPETSVFTGYTENPTGSIRLGGKWYSASDLNFQFDGHPSIEGNGFVLPPGGNTEKTYTVTVPAKFGVVSGGATDWNSWMPFDLIVPPGKLTLTFDYRPENVVFPSAYWFQSGTYIATTSAPTPEPSGLLMLGSAVLGVAGVLRRKFAS